MQPYFMPYIGYWQLIKAVDKYVVYDDVNYIKGGWVNRNNILINSEKKLFSISLCAASPNKLFNEIEVGDDFRKFTKTLQANYSKAPYYAQFMPVFEQIISYPERQLALFISNSLIRILNYLQIDTEIVMSSSLDKDCSLKGQDKVLDICHRLGADRYVNAIGGQELYDKNEFKKQGVELNFLSPHSDITYQQYKNDFVPWLSIIDVLMFNSAEDTNTMLDKYTLL